MRRADGLSSAVAAALLLVVGCQPGSSSVSGPDDDDPVASDGPGGRGTSGDAGDEGPRGEPAPWDEGVFIPATEQVPGDPEAGYWALLNEGYVSCGIPYPLFGLAKAALGSFASLDPLPGRTGKNADVPMNWTVHTTSSGAEIVSLNCLECHAGRFNGELVMGLGRADVDYTSNFGSALQDFPIPEIPVPGLDELQRFVARYQTLGPRIQMPSVGTNPADMVAIVLASHRDQDTLAWQDEENYPIPDVVAPVDTPPWWRVQKKHGLFYNGMARGDHRATMMFASSLCTDDVQEAEGILAYFNNVRAYVASVEAPAYPFAVDEELAQLGHGVYAQTCAGCHGTYGASDDEDTYPTLIFPVEFVGTDPIAALGAAQSGLVEWFNGSFYGDVGELTPTEPFPGYTAPPLDGIWATAPFFHNASVPTLELVLDSAARPKYWRRVDYDSRNFDQATLGWPFVELESGHAEVPPDQAKYIYDTTLIGHANTGHTFGDHLTPEQRRAVLEYLKTL